MTRAVMWCLLSVVAAAAAVLSFAALRDLALLCGFDRGLAWMMPVVVDAGAAAGALIWLGTSSPVRALRFARTLTWVLLASSVAGNAVTHYLAAYGLRPAWWLVVIVSAVAPSVLGSTIHLAVLVGRTAEEVETPAAEPIEQDNSKLLPVAPSLGVAVPAPSQPKRAKTLPAPTDRTVSETKAAALLASGAGRRKLARALDISEHQARVLLEQHAAEKAPNNGVKVLEEAK